jgi:hypothetical protein
MSVETYPFRPSGTSPKYDKKRSECGFKIYIMYLDEVG